MSFRAGAWIVVWILSFQFVRENEVILEMSQALFAWRRLVWMDPAEACLRIEQEPAVNERMCHREIWHRSDSDWAQGCPRSGSEVESLPRYWRLVLTCHFPLLFFSQRKIQWVHLLLE